MDNSRRCDDVNSGSFSHSSRASPNSSMIAVILAAVRSPQSPLQRLSHHSRHRSHPGQPSSVLAFIKQHSSRYSPTVLNLLPSKGSQRKTLRMSPPFLRTSSPTTSHLVGKLLFSANGGSQPSVSRVLSLAFLLSLSLVLCRLRLNTIS